jgi:tetraacyldisaccharide 4'-kinase
MLKAPKFWYQNKISILAILLLPVSLLWIIGTLLKKKFAKPIHAKVPVIAVGSAIIGGSGKTPSVIYVCEILEKIGYKPHIISRGYGGSANEVIKVSPDMNYSLVGDEAIMMSKYYPTWVSKNKYSAFSMAEKDGANILVLDDALQSYNVFKNLNIYVYDSIQSFGNKLIIPSGPLRESINSVLNRSQIVFLVNTDNCPEISQGQFQQSINYEISIKPEISDKKLMPFAGLGFNKKFFDQLYNEGLDITITKEFPDHHQYSQDDMFTLLDEANKNDSFLVTTEKDHLRIPKEFKSSVGIIYGKMVSNNQTDLASEIEKYI